MFEEIIPDLYRIEIPLPESPLKALNSYLVKASNRFLLVDTGLNRKECKSAMLSSLRELGVDLNKTDFFITHLHADHLSLVAELASSASKIYFNRTEASINNFLDHLREMSELYYLNGFPEDILEIALEKHPASRNGLSRAVDFFVREEGDTIEIGDFCFKCIETPGHSPGHMCLYEANKKLLISGDHILFDITPNITLWSNTCNALKEYLESLDKVYNLEIDFVLPGHRNIARSHRNRIEELKHHHEVRAGEIITALMDGEKNAYQIASLISWDVDYPSFESFPGLEKWFAGGETLAHIKYLEENGSIRSRIKEHVKVYSLNPESDSVVS